MADFLKRLFLIINWIVVSITYSLVAKDYGEHGQVFPIEEEDLIEYIQGRIQNSDRLMQECHNLFLHPVSDLNEAQEHTIHYFDPISVTKVDIKDAEGKVLIPRGASYNPLEHGSLSQELLFFDGNQERHIQWAKNRGQETKWILIKGDPFELEEKEKRPVFFDQYGSLIKKLSIRSIPTRVVQEGKRLKVESVPVKDIVCSSS